MKRVVFYTLFAAVVAACLWIIAKNEGLIQARLAEHVAVVAQREMQETETCVMENNGTVNVSFNGSETDFSTIGPMMEATVQELMGLVKQTGADQPELQSMNYNVNDNYRWSGNISLLVKPGDKVAAAATLLQEKGYKVNFNMNTYRRCSYGIGRR